MQKIIFIIHKSMFGIIGGICAILAPTIDYAFICTLAVLMDCYTAWRLSVRVRKTMPEKTDGKFKSSYARKILSTILKIYSLIILAFLIDKYILPFNTWHLPNIVAGAFCFIQIWSILENESSCNGSTWAKLVQRVMVNKAERHFDIDLTELKQKENNLKESKDE